MYSNAKKDTLDEHAQTNQIPNKPHRQSGAKEQKTGWQKNNIEKRKKSAERYKKKSRKRNEKKRNKDRKRNGNQEQKR